MAIRMCPHCGRILPKKKDPATTAISLFFLIAMALALWGDLHARPMAAWAVWALFLYLVFAGVILGWQLLRYLADE